MARYACMVGICRRLDRTEIVGAAAAGGSAMGGRFVCGSGVRFSHTAAAGGDVQSASGVSGLERGETQGRDSRDDPANRLDGRRILAIPAVRAAEHPAERGAGWFGK